MEPILEGCDFQYGSCPNGDFGDLERVEFEGGNKVRSVDFWSKGWISIDIYEHVLNEQQISLLLGPDE